MHAVPMKEAPLRKTLNNELNFDTFEQSEGKSSLRERGFR